MAASMLNPVSFMMPGMAEYQIGQLQLQRQQALADALRQQSLEPIQQQTAGGWVVPNSPMQGLAQLGKAFMANKAQEGVDQRTLALLQGLRGGMGAGDPFAPGTTGTASPSPQSYQQALDVGAQSEAAAPRGVEDTALFGPSGNIGPTNENAARGHLISLLRGEPTTGGSQGGAFNPYNLPREQALMMFFAAPTEVVKARLDMLKPTDKMKFIEEAMRAADPAIRQAAQAIVQKEGYIAPINVRQGGVAVSPLTGQPILANPAATPGTMNQWQPGSPYPSSNVLVPGAQENAARGTGLSSAATQYGKNVYGVPQSYQTPGAPTGFTPMQAIEEATGSVPPAPWQNPALIGGAAPNTPSLPSPIPMQQQPRVDLSAPNDPAALGMANELNAQNVPFRVGIGGMPGAPIPSRRGMSLQDQEAAKAQIKAGEGLGEVGNRIRIAGMDANLKINKFERLGNMLDSIETGKLQPMGYELAAYAQSLGFNIAADTSNFQAAKSLANEMALELRNPAGGAGMPGNFSDQDRRYLQGIIANVDKVPGANKLLLDGMIKMFQRDREIAALANQFKKSHQGVLTDDFFDEVQKYSDSHPLFPPSSQYRTAVPNAAPSNSGAPSSIGSVPPAGAVRRIK